MKVVNSLCPRKKWQVFVVFLVDYWNDHSSSHLIYNPLHLVFIVCRSSLSETKDTSSDSCSTAIMDQGFSYSLIVIVLFAFISTFLFKHIFIPFFPYILLMTTADEMQENFLDNDGDDVQMNASRSTRPLLAKRISITQFIRSRHPPFPVSIRSSTRSRRLPCIWNQRFIEFCALRQLAEMINLNKVNESLCFIVTDLDASV